MTQPQVLTFSDLITRGYFHDRVIPPLSGEAMSVAEAEITAYIAPIIQRAESDRFRLHIPRNRCVQHSVPKRKHTRRMLSIPNPLPYAILCQQIAANWPRLYQLASNSPISLSSPVPSQRRALEGAIDRKNESSERIRRSVGCRYLLKTDLVRYYPSIYTHSIPWAIDGKDASRRDPANILLGNRIDICVREAQDKQTGGIPIGPDTSFLLGEIVATRLDEMLRERLGDELRGTRYIDDYHLYFRNRSDVDNALSVLHRSARELELEVNDEKTEVIALPEPIEPTWKTQLRNMPISGPESEYSIKALFDRAAEFAPIYSYDSIFTYVAKKLLRADDVDPEQWQLCEPLLLRAALSEPSMLRTMDQLYRKHELNDPVALSAVIESLCAYHAPLQHSTEVAWSLWLAKSYNISLSAQVASYVAQVDDDIVALVALGTC